PFTFSVDSFDIYPLPEFVNHPYLLYDVDRGMYFPIGETTMVTAMDVKRVSTLRRLLSYLSNVSPFREITIDRSGALLLEEMGLSPYYPLYLVLEPIMRLVKMFRVLTPELLVVGFYSPFNLSAENISVSDETYLKRWKPWELDVNAEVRGGRVKILDDYVMLALAKLSSKYPDIGNIFIIEESRNVEGGSSLRRLVDSLAGDLEEAVQTLLEAYRLIRSVKPSVKLVIE
ncbi:MAG: hypothetical protein GXO26_02080, partial [Crenarchaeota archaeon]|nr:hypothetical protein [Thermoproteota archaeon]